MLGMQRMFESFLQMHESAGRLNQPLEKIRVGRVGLEPELFQNVVCLVVTLLIPATEKRTVTAGVLPLLRGPRPHLSPVDSANHCEILSRLFMGSFNLVAAQRMSKPPNTNSSEGHPHSACCPWKRKPRPKCEWFAAAKMTSATLVVVLAAIAILIFCSALFSRVETALFLLKPHQLRRLQENHARLTSFIQLFRENPRRVLNVLLLGDGLVNVLLVVLCLFFLWEGPLAGRVPQWLAGILIFAIVVFLCDLVPKLVALAAPSRVSAIGAFTLQIAMPLLDRIGRGLETVSDYVIDHLTPAHLRTRPRLSDEELGTLLQIGEEEGALVPRRSRNDPGNHQAR